MAPTDIPEFVGAWEYDPNTGVRLEPMLNCLGELQSYNVDGSGNYEPLGVSFLGEESRTARVAGPPLLSGSMLVSRTQSSLSWVPNADQSDVPPVTSWEVERQLSTNGGTSFGSWAPITGSPFSAATLARNETGLPTAATPPPENIFGYRVRGINSVGNGTWSNEKRVAWASTPAGQPLAPTNFNHGAPDTTSVPLFWTPTFPVDGSVTKLGIFLGNTLFRDNIGASLASYVVTGLTPGQQLTNLNVRAFNNWSGGSPAGWSPASNNFNVTIPTIVPKDFVMMTGVANSSETHGGSNDWQGWRVYQEPAMFSIANRTGVQGAGGNSRPLFLAYSEDGPNLGGNNPNYTTVYNHARAVLDDFYYNSTPSTHSARWGIKLFWSNGNENSDKGALSPKPAVGAQHTDTQVARYLVSMNALYDAVHYAPGGTRRYPDAYCGSNPTMDQERSGFVQKWLHASARYHDFVMWSMYPPGRGRGDPVLHTNPRLDWPTFNEANRSDRRSGFLIRCFYRTYQAQLQARIDTGDPNFSISISCGEYGLPSSPADRGERPYYIVHGGIGAMWILARQYGLVMDFACYWDTVDTEANSPHNPLADEAPNGDHNSGGGATGNNTVATNPTSRVAWQRWIEFDKRQPGSSQPAQWSGNPKPTGSATGTTWTQSGTPV